MRPPSFGADFRAELETLLMWRRDVRRFRPEPLPDGALERLLSLASLAPSVGLSEPWRFVIVETPAVRDAMRASFTECNARALAGYDGERARTYAGLKLAGFDASAQFALFADHATAQGHSLGRLTMPETLDYSAVLAVHTVWLAARAQGIGLGWVSILDPAKVHALLAVPKDWRFIGYFCLGYSVEDDHTPALARAGWEDRKLTTITRR